MNKAVRVILVAYLLGVVLVCTYVPVRPANGTGWEDYRFFAGRYAWIVTGPFLVPLELDVYRIGVELLAVSALAGAAVVVAWRRPAPPTGTNTEHRDDPAGGP